MIKAIFFDESSKAVRDKMFRIVVDIYIIFYMIRAFKVILDLAYIGNLFTFGAMTLGLYMVFLILFGLFMIIKKVNIELLFLFMLLVQLKF